MRRGIANDLATPTSAGGSEVSSMRKYWRGGDECCVISYVGDEASGMGLE